MNINDTEQIEAKKQASHFGIDFISLRGLEIPKEILEIIPEDIARKNQLIVYKKQDSTIYIAVADPKKLQEKAPDILTDLKKDKGFNFKLAITTPSDLLYAMLGYKQKNVEQEKNIHESDNVSSVKSIPRVNLKAIDIDLKILNKIPEKISQKYRIIVFNISEDGNKIKIAVEDPDNLQTQEILDYIKVKNNVNIDEYQTDKEGIDWQLKKYSEITKQKEKKADNVKIEIKSQEPIKEKLENFKKPEIIEEKKEIKIEEVKEIKEFEKPKIEVKLEPQMKVKPAVEIKEEKKSIEKLYEPSKDIKTVSVANIIKEEGGIAEKKEFTLPAPADEEQILDKILPSGIKNIDDLVTIIKEGSIPKIVAAMIEFAIHQEASDIHIEEDEKHVRLRFRLDGVLKEIVRMPQILQAPIISRIKILSRLKIDEQRIPQDGRFDVQIGDKQIDIRVSTLPTIHGEKCEMRLLDKTVGLIELEKLGLVGENLKRLNEAIAKPYGIIFITGPTGSGKTTTLYAILKKLNDEKVNIVTLEDPVEYELPGINQCQIKPKIGFGFAEGLRSILRQDPNIIMVGEIRDAETANMATHAALTGHLVLSTLHTNDSSGAMPRLIDMGVEPFLITSSINAIVAQRLVRKLCPKCKTEAQVPEKMLSEIKQTLLSANDAEIKNITTKPFKFYKAVGCSECKDGYKGRMSLFEVLSITERIEQLTINRVSSSIIKRAAMNQGLITIRMDGFYKAALGVTSIDEVIRVTSR